MRTVKELREWITKIPDESVLVLDRSEIRVYPPNTYSSDEVGVFDGDDKKFDTLPFHLKEIER